MRVKERMRKEGGDSLNSNMDANKRGAWTNPLSIA